MTKMPKVIGMKFEEAENELKIAICKQKNR